MVNEITFLILGGIYYKRILILLLIIKKYDKKIENLQKITISLNIFDNEKSFEIYQEIYY